MNWYVQAFQKYADFNGRSRRSEYWYFVLINTLIVWGIIIIEFVLKTYGILTALYAIGTIVPAFAVTVRRLHDTGRSGWNILLGLIPIVGGVIVLIFLLEDSQVGENRYGAAKRRDAYQMKNSRYNKITAIELRIYKRYRQV